MITKRVGDIASLTALIARTCRSCVDVRLGLTLAVAAQTPLVQAV